MAGSIRCFPIGGFPKASETLRCTRSRGSSYDVSPLRRGSAPCVGELAGGSDCSASVSGLRGEGDTLSAVREMSKTESGATSGAEGTLIRHAVENLASPVALDTLGTLRSRLGEVEGA